MAKVSGRLARTKHALRTKTELCSLVDLYGDALANGRNDISHLIRKRGWGIAKRDVRHEGGEWHTHYALTYDAETQPKQLALISA